MSRVCEQTRTREHPLGSYCAHRRSSKKCKGEPCYVPNPRRSRR